MKKHILTTRIREIVIKNLFALLAFLSVLLLGLIVLFLFREGLPLFREISVRSFLFGSAWYPTYDPPEYGIWPLIVGSLIVTALASLIAVPLGLLCAVYIAEIAHSRIKEILKSVIELLAGLPSVVLGFFGMVIIAPWMQEAFDLPTGLNIVNASAMLAVMAIPTIASISEDALYAVPRDFKEAAYALGATKYETVTRIVFPAALSGISTAVILGMARAVGETMVVLMVAGGSAALPRGLFDSVRPMTASIAAEMGEAPFGSGHYHALFATGIVLFVVTLGFNLIADYISNRFKEEGSGTL
ncbi:MAG: phosphate ABC transporter permease subunit PstC [Deltaproteobacteria bacterium]|nr:phosphate ABC transporter permease subunit PstC [Deltaproteobacteria bacterium]